MVTPYGPILSSTAAAITRLVLADGGLILQTFRLEAEVHLAPPEVTTLLQALSQAPAYHADPVLQRLLDAERPQAGQVCACDGQAGVHVASVGCRVTARTGQEEA